MLAGVTCFSSCSYDTLSSFIGLCQVHRRASHVSAAVFPSCLTVVVVIVHWVTSAGRHPLSIYATRDTEVSRTFPEMLAQVLRVTAHSSGKSGANLTSVGEKLGSSPKIGEVSRNCWGKRFKGKVLIVILTFGTTLISGSRVVAWYFLWSVLGVLHRPIAQLYCEISFFLLSVCLLWVTTAWWAMPQSAGGKVGEFFTAGKRWSPWRDSFLLECLLRRICAK